MGQRTTSESWFSPSTVGPWDILRWSGLRGKLFCLLTHLTTCGDPRPHTHHFLRWSRLLAGKLQESACLPSPSITGAAATPSFVYVSSADGTRKRFTLLSYPSSPSPFFRDSLCSPGNLSSWSSCLSTSSLQAYTTKPGVFNFFFFWLNYCLYILLFC